MSDRSGEWVDQKLTEIHEKAYTEPVSYTHLDVYKRQALKLPTIPAIVENGSAKRQVYSNIA